MVVSPLMLERTVFFTRFTEIAPAFPLPCCPPPPVAAPSEAVTLIIWAFDTASTERLPTWVRLATLSTLAVVVLVTPPNAKPTPRAPLPPNDRPPPTITRLVASVARTTVAPVIVLAPATLASRAVVV